MKFVGIGDFAFGRNFNCLLILRVLCQNKNIYLEFVLMVK